MYRAPDTASTLRLPEIAVSDHRIPGGAAGVEIHVRRKRLASLGAVDPDKVVVFVHGATYPGSVAFDHAMLGGGSWLDYLALHGFDTFVFDVRGYGRSSRPALQGDRATRDLPYARTPEALADLTAVVEFARAQAQVAQVNLIGWSWGTAISGGFAAVHGDRLRHLLLVAPLWTIRATPAAALSRWMMSALPWPSTGTANFLGAFRKVNKAEARARWVRGLAPAVAEQLMPMAEFDRWWEALCEIQGDPGSHGRAATAANGVMADLIELWANGRPTYKPENITVPTQLLVGEWDVDTPPYMAQELFSHLTAAPYKRLEILARGTHSMALELNRVDLYRRTREFLETQFLKRPG